MNTLYLRLKALGLQHRFGAAVLFVLLFVTLALATRIALTIQASEVLTWNVGLVAAYAWGTVFDLAAAGWWSLPLVLGLSLVPANGFKYRVLRLLVHGVIYFILCALLFTGLAEWLFWDEFGARFNFIAVDYLVYTQEVIGNIRESYPMPIILGSIGLCAAALHFALLRTALITTWLDHAVAPARRRWRFAALWTAVVVALGLGLSEELLPSWKNNYSRELAKNGPWSFVAAFRSNHLDYDQFYATIPNEQAFSRMHQILARDGSTVSPDAAKDGQDLLRQVHAPRPTEPEQRLNVIQITVESLSADFVGRYGSTSGWTPNLDELSTRSLIFENFYATGTRTDRGMEALSLSVPPTPGRSLVKRPDNGGLFTLGSVFRTRGYDTSFIYGGYGYFDNMNTFFGGNGYRVVDRTTFTPSEVTFANAWGACDEDLFNRALREADQANAAGKPFFQFLMTTSNHRPFTYPDGRIDLPSKTSKRPGGVKYTDYAIGKFIREAATHPWFNQTVFVIVADHCASSAGRTELPVQNYHIPLIIHAPGGQIAPGVVKTLASQVDYAPTLLALLNWSYPSRFFGWDVTAPNQPAGRALLGNYQKLGLFDGEHLAILAPVRQRRAFNYGAAKNTLSSIPADHPLVDDAIANYQTASWLFQNHRQTAYPLPVAP